MVNPGVVMRLVALSLVAMANASFSTENVAAKQQPQIIVQPSDYVALQNTTITATKNATSLDGDFTVLGEGVFGHFDVVVYDDSGNVVRRVTSDSRSYRKDRGPRIKSFGIDIGSGGTPAKVEVSFHEMRINPTVGACVPK